VSQFKDNRARAPETRRIAYVERERERERERGREREREGRAISDEAGERVEVDAATPLNLH